jgi:hypothetical protein
LICAPSRCDTQPVSKTQNTKPSSFIFETNGTI